jgi:general secretion pathway protein G
MVTGMPIKMRRGFTLVELLVVLGIVALLLTLAAPRVFPRLDGARDTILAENLRATRSVIDQFHADTGRYPDSLDQLVERKYLPALPFDPVADSDAAWILVAPEEAGTGAQRQAVCGVVSCGSGARPASPISDWSSWSPSSAWPARRR